MADAPAKLKRHTPPAGNQPTGSFTMQRMLTLIASGSLHTIILLIISQLMLSNTPERSTRLIRVSLSEPPANERTVDLRTLMEVHRRKRIPETVPHTPADPPDTSDVPRPVAMPAPVLEEVHEGFTAPPLVSRKPAATAEDTSGLANRDTEARTGALARYGGTEESERAVDAALDWLRRHQNSNGSWSTCGFTDRCVGETICDGKGHNDAIDTGLTSLALLAFLSGGKHSGSEGPLGDVMRLGIDHLLRVQNTNGRLGDFTRYEMYNHSIATLVIAENFILSGDPKLREPLEAAVRYLLAAQQPQGGWDYLARHLGRSDTSITGFAVMAIKSAHAAGIEIPLEAIFGIAEHFDRMTTPNGQVIYANRDVGAGRRGIGMVAVGAASKQFLGWPTRSSVLERQYEILRANLPNWDKLATDNFHNVYYWYYGTLAMFQAGGEDWELWNGRMRDMLIRNQRQTGCSRGSWDPAGRWLGRHAGRVYSTAMNAMNLQIYYRYLPLYDSKSLPSLQALTMAVNTDQGDARMRALRILGEFQCEESREMLANSLRNEDVSVRLMAAKSLVAREEKVAALPVLIQLSKDTDGFIRSAAVDELVRYEIMEIVPALIDRLTDEQEFIGAKAVDKLRRLCRQNFNWQAGSSAMAKARAATAWHKWYLQFRAGEVTIDINLIIGSVSQVQIDQNLVMINVGRRSDVRLGDDFEVVRDDAVIARLRVHSVGEQFSFARQYMADMEHSVREGDVVRKKRGS